MKRSITRAAAYFCAIVALLSARQAEASVKLPAIFSEHMVVQRETAVPVWGWADAGEEVTVTIAGQTKSAKAAADGKWMVKLDPLQTGTPQALVVKGQNAVTIQDVLIGEVWLGSGQSNMAMQVSRAQNLAEEKAASNLPEIRMFTEQSGASDQPQTMEKGEWVVCTPETVERFSAALYFFGRQIHQALHVPVGLINSSVGGTPIESWIDRETQEKAPELKPLHDQLRAENANFNAAAAKAKFDKDLAAWKEAAGAAKAEGKAPPKAPRDPVASRERKGNFGGLFNGKIAPLIPYAIRGAIWYQGEANSVPAKAPYYQYELPLLVSDWRARWGEGDFPFAWAQLPNYDVKGNNWPLVREAMLKSLKLQNTGMAINIDIGEQKNIHPQNKQEVGRRLTLWALGTVYGQKVASTSGPLPAGFQVRGSDVVLSFTHADGGLVAKGGELTGFALAGEDEKFVPAQAKIDGDKVVVSSKEVTKPVAVRYAWENWPTCNLYNGAGLPASPFRTDDWP